MASTVDWRFARSVAERVAGDDDTPAYQRNGLEADLIELTARAEILVTEETGLVSGSGPARARITDRMGWVDANLASFERLIRPLLGRFEGTDDRPAGASGPIAAVGRAAAAVGGYVGPKVSGAELGGVLGWLSGRVLGQYDLLIIEDDRPDDQDWVYYVAPNLLELEKRYGFPPAEFRLWIAVHECTHRAQFTGVDWLRPHFLSLVNQLLDSVDTDAGQLLDSLGDAARRLRSGDRSAWRDGGLTALFAGDEQRRVMQQMSGLMSLLEGHGDLVMDRATAGIIPSRKRFARVMSHRRANASPLTRLVQRLTGIEAKLAQYEEGERFVTAVEAAGGRELFDQVWSGPEMLPTLDEIRSPSLWLARAGVHSGA
ncbi:MAG: zinc-dependent metalloprotease [Acidimicrobiales bacterium]